MNDDQPAGAPVPPSSPPQPRTQPIRPPQRPPWTPPWLWRVGSAATVALVGNASRVFLRAFNTLEVSGLDQFLKLLNERSDVEGRTKGLITAGGLIIAQSIDDPLLFGALPLSYHWDANNNRWGLGSHDLMFKNRFTSLFFTLGQCLPTHRIQHSTNGGLWQPTMTEAVRLLSSQPFVRPERASPSPPSSSFPYSLIPSSHSASPPSQDPVDLIDPFTRPFAPVLYPTFSTTGADSFPSPSYHSSRRHAWIHVFPEGRIHQHPTQTMRYFRWGVSRLILEAEPCPDVVPVWIEGFQDVMSDTRGFPRPVPRPGKTVRVDFGDVVKEEVWDGYRRRWRGLVEESKKRTRKRQQLEDYEEKDIVWNEIGVVQDDWLKYGREAVELRMEVADRVRDELVKMRRARGWPEEDARARLAKTWRGGRNGLKDVEEGVTKT